MIYEKFGENIYVMIDELFYDVVVGAIELPTKLIMIDTGTNLRKIKEFREKVEEVTKKKFETVFITHYHGDHIIGNQHVSDCDIIGSKWTLERLNIGIPKWTDEIIENQKKLIDHLIFMLGAFMPPYYEEMTKKKLTNMIEQFADMVIISIRK